MPKNHFPGLTLVGTRYLANYAAIDINGFRRLLDEPKSDNRTAYQRDRDRVIHSYAFRRLKHKTQVFINYSGEQFRTRLTHSLEVAQIARSLARDLALDEDLTEAIALAHDLGHTAFGHAGEDALEEKVKAFGGFDHNAQALRIVTRLDDSYEHGYGLNLTWQTLEGLVKHNGPLTGGQAAKDTQINHYILAYNKQFDLNLDTFPSLEAQCAAIADDVAYCSHDLEDGLVSGFLSGEELRQVTFWRDLIKDVCHNTSKSVVDACDPIVLAHKMRRAQIKLMVADILQQTKKNLQELAPQHIMDVYKAPYKIVNFSPDMLTHLAEIKGFLFKNLYRHAKVLQQREKAAAIVNALFDLYIDKPCLLPEDKFKLWQSQTTETEQVQVLVDFIADMTDRQAISLYESLIKSE